MRGWLRGMVRSVPAVLVVGAALVAGVGTRLTTPAAGVRPVAFLSPADPVLEATPASGVAGTVVHLQGTGFGPPPFDPRTCELDPANPTDTGYLVCQTRPEGQRGGGGDQDVVVTMETLAGSTWLGRGGVDADGAFELDVAIPAASGTGQVVLVALADNGRIASTVFTVTPTAVPGTPTYAG